MDFVNRISMDFLAYAGIFLTVAGFVAGGFLLSIDEQGWIRRTYDKYVALIDAEHKFLFIDKPGRKVARWRVWGTIITLVVVLFSDGDYDIGMIVSLVVYWAWPIYILRKRHRERLEALELQLDSWLLILANALKATPSLGEAIRASTKIMRKPIGQELDLLLKEINLGTPLDIAIRAMSERIGSPLISGALATILVGRQTGGDIPRILEESAATLREMQRLEGVVRTKTAEGKSQAYVLGAIPFVLIGAIQIIDPNWLKPLTETTIGFIVIAVAMVLWIGAILAARKILAVDI
jgi:tight adherence protein B